MPICKSLLDKHRRRLARLFCGNVGELLELIGADLTEIAEEEDKG